MLERASASLSGTSADGWASEQAATQQVSLAELVPTIKRSFWVIAGCVFAAVLLALFYIAITPSSYVATAQLLIGSGKQPYLLQDNVVDLTIDNAQVESQVEVLRSERVANDVVGALGLEHDPDFRSDDASTDYERHRIALARFRDGLSTRRVGQSYVIEVSFRSTDPDKAARITNAITAAYIRDQLSAKTDVAQQASQWMQERVTELSAKLNTAAAAVQKFRAENGISDNNTNNQPRLIDKLTGLEAQAQAYRKLYESFLQKLTENQQQESYPVSNARVITEASTPLAKTYPKSKLILLLSVLLGLIAAAAVAAIRSVLDGSVRNAKQIRQVLGLDWLASLPTYRQNDAAAGHVEALDAPFSPFSDAIRGVKVSLQNASRGKPVLCLGVMSLLPGEGKSTLAANLAALFAASGSKTLLIDADCCAPSLGRRLAPVTQRGLVEALRDGPEESITLDPKTEAFILPLSHPERLTNSADLLASPAMKELLAQLAAGFAIVIFDLPPLSRAVDARVLGPQLDQCILLVEWGRTPLEQLKEVVDLLRAEQIPVLGTIINKVEDGVPPLFGWRPADLRQLRQSGYFDWAIHGVSSRWAGLRSWRRASR
jgi:Mrp family chromosome partitioning ATPase/capsular polysaccharide biosynthesis protein